ncbi:hypothetical protein, partial [Salmonella sp. SAL4438]|uniref:hypothetical protein n=1 Tax=Salmonella sp. SAL4438 TaxID=3159893 RepID=UPI00397B5E2E
IGGAINLVANKPTSTLEGEVEAVVGNYDRREYTGIVNAPIMADRASLRVAATHIEHSGYSRSLLLDRELDDEDTNFVRAQLGVT